MTLQLEIKPETFDALDAKAKAKSLALETYIERLLEERSPLYEPPDLSDEEPPIIHPPVIGRITLSLAPPQELVFPPMDEETIELE